MYIFVWLLSVGSKIHDGMDKTEIMFYVFYFKAFAETAFSNSHGTFSTCHKLF